MRSSAVVGLAALTGLALYNTVSARLRDRNDVGEQIADLSRLTADLAKHMAEIKRSLTAAENKVDSAVNRVRAAVEPVTSEIGELGVLVKQLAETVAVHEAALAARAAAPQPVLVDEPAAPMIAPAAPAPAIAPGSGFKALDAGGMVASIREAIDANRIDLYLQPIVTLPQRKVRFYEALTRLRTAGGEHVMARRFHAACRGRRPDAEGSTICWSSAACRSLRRLLIRTAKSACSATSRRHAERSGILRAILRFHGRQPRAGAGADVRVPAGRLPRHGADRI